MPRSSVSDNSGGEDKTKKSNIVSGIFRRKAFAVAAFSDRRLPTERRGSDGSSWMKSTRLSMNKSGNRNKNLSPLNSPRLKKKDSRNSSDSSILVSVTDSGSSETKKMRFGKKKKKKSKKDVATDLKLQLGRSTSELTIPEVPVQAVKKTGNDRYQELMKVPQKERNEVWLAEVVKLMDSRVQHTMHTAGLGAHAKHCKNVTSASGSKIQKDTSPSSTLTGDLTSVEKKKPPSPLKRRNSILDNKFIQADGLAIERHVVAKLQKKSFRGAKKPQNNDEEIVSENKPRALWSKAFENAAIERKEDEHSEEEIHINKVFSSSSSPLQLKYDPVEIVRPPSYKLYKERLLAVRIRQREERKPLIDPKEMKFKSRNSYERWKMIQRIEIASRTTARLLKRSKSSIKKVEEKKCVPKYIPKITTDSESSDSGLELSYEGPGVSIATDTDSESDSDYSDYEPITTLPPRPVDEKRYTGLFIRTSLVRDLPSVNKPRSLLCKHNRSLPTVPAPVPSSAVPSSAAPSADITESKKAPESKFLKYYSDSEHKQMNTTSRRSGQERSTEV